MTNLICSADSKAALVRLINRYYLSEFWTITDDNRAYNTRLDRYSDNIIIVKNGRWRFELPS